MTTIIISFGAFLIFAVQTASQILSHIKNEQPSKPMQLMTRSSTNKKILLRPLVSNILAIVGICVLSYKLLGEYQNITVFTHRDAFNMGIMFAGIIFNIITILLNGVKKLVYRWIDNFLEMHEATQDFMFEMFKLPPVKRTKKQ